MSLPPVVPEPAPVTPAAGADGPDGRSGADPARFEAVVLPHLDAAFALARWLLRDEHDAQDAVQDAYLRAFRHFRGYRGGDARAWVLAIVRNVCHTLAGRRSAAAHEPIDGPEGARIAAEDDPEAALLRRAGIDDVHAAIGRLPLEFREVVVLRELEGLSYREIAEVAGVPIGTVMSRLARARALLRRMLAAHAGGDR